MKKTLLTERFQQLAGIKPLYEKNLNEGISLEKLMNGDKVNNDIVVVPNISFKDEKEARYNAMRPVDIERDQDGDQQIEFTKVRGRPGGNMMFRVEDGVVQGIKLLSDLKF